MAGGDKVLVRDRKGGSKMRKGLLRRKHGDGSWTVRDVPSILLLFLSRLSILRFKCLWKEFYEGGGVGMGFILYLHVLNYPKCKPQNLARYFLMYTIFMGKRKTRRLGAASVRVFLNYYHVY